MDLNKLSQSIGTQIHDQADILAPQIKQIATEQFGMSPDPRMLDLTAVDGDTIKSGRILGFDTMESYDSDKARKLAEQYGISISDQKKMGLAGKDALKAYLQVNPNPDVEVMGSDKYGRRLLQIPGLAEHMIQSGVATPTDRYDQKTNALFHAAKDKRTKLFGEQANEAFNQQREYNIGRQAPSFMEGVRNTFSALGAGTQETVAGIGDFALDVVTPGNNTWLDKAKSSESANANFGYDPREMEYRTNEAVNAFHEGNYGQALKHAVVMSPEGFMHSVPTMAAMFVPGTGVVKGAQLFIGAARAAKAAEAVEASAILKNVASVANKNAGFGATVGMQTNNDIEEFTKNNNGVAPSIDRIAGMTALNTLQMATDKFVFKDILSKEGTAAQAAKMLEKAMKYADQPTALKLAQTVAKTAVSFGEEGGQEYLQQWAQILNQKLGTEKYGDFNQLLKNPEVLDEALGAGIMGAGIGGGMSMAHSSPSLLGNVRDLANTGLDAIANVKQDSKEKAMLQEAGVADVAKPSKQIVKEGMHEVLTGLRDNSISFTDAFTKLNEIHDHAEHEVDKANIQKIRSMVAQKLSDQEMKPEDVVLGSKAIAEDMISNAYDYATEEVRGSKIFESNINRIAESNGISTEELVRIRDRAAVESEVSVEDRGYRTYGQQLRSYMQNPEANAAQIENVTSKMEKLKNTTESSLEVLQNTVDELTAKATSGFLSRSGSTTIDKDLYGSLNEKGYVVHHKNFLTEDGQINTKAPIFKTIEDKKRTLAGIAQELQKSNVVLSGLETQAEPQVIPAVVTKEIQTEKPITMTREQAEELADAQMNEEMSEKWLDNASDADVDLWMNKRIEKLMKSQGAAAVHHEEMEGNVGTKVKPKYEVATLSKVPEAEKIKVRVKAMMATQYIGFGKDTSSTKHYYDQLSKQGMPVNSGAYTKDDVVFTSINGTPSKENYTSTLKYVITALEAGATVLTDSSSYIAGSKYNNGERELAKELTKRGYTYTDAQGQKDIGIWVKQLASVSVSTNHNEKVMEGNTVPVGEAIKSNLGKDQGKMKSTEQPKEQELDISKVVKHTVKEGEVLTDKGVSSLAPESKAREFATKVVGVLSTVVEKLNPTDKRKHMWNLKDSPTRTILFDKDGHVNANVATAIGLAAEEYVAFNSKDFRVNRTREDVARSLGMDVRELSREGYMALKDKGVPVKLVANSLGSTILGNLGISENKKGEDLEQYAKLKADIGLYAIQYMINQGYVKEPTSMGIQEYAKHSGMNPNEILQNDAKINFLVVDNINSTTSKELFKSVSAELGTKATVRRGPLSEVPPLADKNTKARNNKISEIPEDIIDAMNKQKQAKYVKEKSAIAWVLDPKNEDAVLRHMGYKKQDVLLVMSKSQRESAEATNQEILDSIEALKDLENMDEMYFDYFFSKNGRFFIDSNTVNPQTNKLHRFLVVLEGQKTTVDMNDNDLKTGFQFAMAQAAGMGTDKVATSDVKAFADKIIGLGSKGLERALNDSVYAEANHIEIEHLGHYLQAIEALKAMEASTDGKFDTYMSAEFDDVTSGFAIKLLQMPFLKDIVAWLRKVGVNVGSVKDDMSFNDELASKEFRDAYQTLAADIKQSNMTPDDNMMGMWNAIKGILPEMKDDVISKELRSLFKDPFMTFNYAAGLPSIKKSLGYNIIDGVIGDLAKTGDKHVKLQNTIVSMIQMKEYKSLQEMLRNEDLSNIKLKSPITVGKQKIKTLEDYLLRLMEDTYGKEVENVLKDNFGDFMKANTIMNGAFRMMFNAYKVKYDEAIKNHQGKLTTEAKLEIIKTLRDTFPLIKGPDSKSIYEGIPIVDTKNVQTEAAIGAAQIKLEGKASLKAQLMIKEFEAAMNAGAVIPIHFIDGSAMAKLMIKFARSTLGIHDAIIPSIANMVATVKDYNTGWFDTNAKYSVIEALAESMASVLDTLTLEQKSKVEKIELTLEDGMHPSLTGREAEKYNVDFESMLSMLNHLANRVNEARVDLFKNTMQVAHMAAMPGSTAVSNGVKIEAKDYTNTKIEFNPVRVKAEDTTQETSEVVAQPEDDVRGSKLVMPSLQDYEDMADAYEAGKYVLPDGVVSELNASRPTYTHGNRQVPIKISSVSVRDGEVSVTLTYGKDGKKEYTHVYPYEGSSKIKLNQKEINSVLRKYESVRGSQQTEAEVKERLDKMEKLDEGFLKDTKAMVDLAKDLGDIDGEFVSEEHKSHLVKMIGMLKADFFPKLDVYLSNKAAQAHGMLNLTKKHIELHTTKNKPLYNNTMGNMEMYVHELFHAISAFALESKYANTDARPIIRKITHIKDLASKHLVWEDFRPADSVNAVEEDKIAKEMYNYIFNNGKGEGLDEFIAHALTNEKIMAKLKDVQLKEDNNATTLLDSIIYFVGKLLDVVMGKYNFNDSNKTVNAELQELVLALAEYNNKAERRRKAAVTPIEKFYALVEVLNTKGNIQYQKLVKYIESKADNKLPRNPSKFETAQWLAKNVFKLVFSDKYRPQLETVLSIAGMPPEGLVQSWVRDVSTKPDMLMRTVEKLIINAGIVDQTRNSLAVTAKTSLRDAFSRKLKPSEKHVLTVIGLDTDLSSLVGTYSMTEIKDMMSDDSVLQAEIKKVKDQLGELDRANLSWYSNQAHGLGKFMATGVAGIAQNLNAHNIASLNFTEKKVRANAKIVKLVDHLATMYALKYSPIEAKGLFANLIETEKDGIENYMKQHTAFKEESRDKLFNSEALMIKGYSKEILDDSVSILIKPVGLYNEMKDAGYDLVQVLEKAPGDTSTTKMAMFKSKTFVTQSYNRAATNMTGTVKRGTSLTDIRNSGNEVLAKAKAMIDIKKLNEQQAKIVKQMQSKDYDFHLEEVGLVPVVNDAGNVSDYRYMMNKEMKRKEMNQDTDGLNVLAQMYAANFNKVGAEKNNMAVLDVINEDQKVNYIDGEAHGNNGKEYIKIYPKSPSKDVRDLYKILPENMKKQIDKSADGFIAVRRDMLVHYFGFRNMSIMDGWVGKITPKEFHMMIRAAEKIYMEFVKVYKVGIIIRTPAVLWGNIVSNIMQSIATGNPPWVVLKRSIENARNIREYLEDHKAIMKIEYEMQAGNKKNEHKLNALKESMKRNPLKPLMDAGMYQSIVEDVSMSEFKSASKLSQYIEEKTSGVPEIIKNGAHWLYLSEKTGFYRFMNQATQYSDLVARATEYQFMIEKGSSEKEALETVLDMFVNYSNPSTKIEQWANDMGLIMFTKYFKRIQRAIGRNIIKHPVSFAMAIMGQSIFGDVDDISDQSLFTKNYSGMIHSPLDVMGGVIAPGLVRNIIDVGKSL